MTRSTFIFKENHDFTEEEDNPSHKVVLAEEELAAIDINGIANLVDRPRIAFIDEECETVVVGGDEIEVSMIFLLVISSCGWLENKLKGRELFPDRMNKDYLDLIFSQCDRSCCTIQNVKYLIC